MREPDDEVCLCFHVTRRRLERFVRAERPVVASQLSECGGAGTGCGWCVPFLTQIFRRAADDLPDADEYRRRREAYRAAKSGDQS